MESITPLEQYVQIRISKEKEVKLIRMLDDKKNKISGKGKDDMRMLKALKAACNVVIYLNYYYEK